MTYTFDEILEYSGFDYIDYSIEGGDVYFIDIPYSNTVTLSLISSFIADLTNNGFNVKALSKDRIMSIKAFKNNSTLEDALIDEEEIESQELIQNNSARYYSIKKKAQSLNKKLQDLQIEVQKNVGMTDYTKRNKDTKTHEHGRYGDSSTIYIINPEVNMEELKFILEEFNASYHDAPLLKDFIRADIESVSNNPYLKSLGYSDNETYLSFTLMKNEAYFNPYQNLGRN